jgi:Fur family ferric uptake transcriptional regulator
MGKHCCDTKLDIEKAKQLLTANRVNRTKVKVSVLISLSKAETPLSVAEIYAKLGDGSCDISTVFRTVGQFKDKGLVRELNLGEGFFRYELISQDAHSHHHHHVRCRDCGEIKHLDDCDLSPFEKMIERLGYKNLEHHLEFTGVCSKCS